MHQMSRRNEAVDLGNCDALTATMHKPRGNWKGSLPTLSQHGSVLVGHMLLVFGGWSVARQSHPLFVCDTRSFCWRQVKLHKSVCNLQMVGCFVHNDTVYAFPARVGGIHNVVLLDLLMLEEWRTVEFDRTLSNMAGVYHDHEEMAILCSGERLVNFYPDELRLERVDVKGTIPPDRDGHGCCVNSTTLFLFGGKVEAYVFHDTLYALTLRTMTWDCITPGSAYIARGRSRFSMSYVHGRIFIMGGNGHGASNTLDVFDLREQRWRPIESNMDNKDAVKLHGSLGGGTLHHSAVNTQQSMFITGGIGLDFRAMRVLTISPYISEE